MEGKFTPTNLDLIEEARKTNDCIRQQELFKHPSDLIKWALANNPQLCSAVIEQLGTDKIEQLRIKTKKEIEDTSKE